MKNYEQKIIVLALKRNVNVSHLSSLKKKKVTLRKKIQDLEVAQKVTQIVAEGLQKKAHDKIAHVVSRCLATIFEEPYQFNIIFEQKRGKTEARLVFNRNGMEVDPLTASGGGAVDVAAFALRLSCLLLNQPPVSKVVILDEPFKFVSVAYRDNIKDLLYQLSKELGLQFIIVTHMTELEMGKVREL